MGFIKSLKDRYGIKKEYVNPKIRICVECGSSSVNVCGKYVFCKECKKIRHFKIKPSIFNSGDCVRILDPDVNSDYIYKIKKIKKSQEGIILYILKSLSDNSEVLYYEGKDSQLQKVIESKTKFNKKSRQ